MFCDEIEPKLYLGAIEAAEDFNTLKTLKITHVVSVDIFPAAVPSSLGIKHMYVSADDKPNEDLLSRFNETNQFIGDALSQGICLVHCFCGVSRSSTIVIAYLMHKYQLSYEDAFQKAKAKRKFVCPNTGFVLQLQLYYKMKWKLDTKNNGFIYFILQHMSRKFLKGHDPAVLKHYFDILQSNQESSDEAVGVHKCKICRQVLFDSSLILLHCPDKKPDWTDPEVQDLSKEDLGVCKESILIQPQSWMIKDFKSSEGKLFCLKCGSKIGCYNWLGLHCTCGALVSPAFKITESKVDNC